MYSGQFFIRLEPDEMLALRELARREKRTLRQQAALAVRHELERLNLLPRGEITAPEPAPDAVREETA
jgi:hypothetical protein